MSLTLISREFGLIRLDFADQALMDALASVK
jgi:hypothetical protein